MERIDVEVPSRASAGLRPPGTIVAVQASSEPGNTPMGVSLPPLPSWAPL